MNITIIGATGMVGSRLVAEALSRGHHITAASRTPNISHDPQVTPIQVDATRHEQLATALNGTEAAILAVRAAAGSEGVIAPITRAVMDEAARTGTRLLVIGGAGPLRSPDDTGRLVIDDPRYVPEAWRQVAGASLSQWDACAEHPYQDWVYLSPPAILEPGSRTGSYRRGTTTLLTAADGSSRISAEDLALAALDEIEDPGTEQHFTVAETTNNTQPTGAPLVGA